MPKSDIAPSQQWDVNKYISQSKVLNKQNNQELENYKKKTEAYKRISSTLDEYESQGLDVSAYRKKLDEKVPDLSFGEKLGVVGRNLGQDYVNSFSKLMGGNLNESHSQKLDNLKNEREEVKNPISTMATEVALDPLTYLPLGAATKGTRTVRALKDFGKGAVASGGTYAAKEYGNDNFKLEDALIAAGFGGLLNSGIGAILNRKVKGDLLNSDVTSHENILQRGIQEGKEITIPKGEKIKDKAVETAEPYADESLQNNFTTNDDEIVNKMMNNNTNDNVKPLDNIQENTNQKAYTNIDERIKNRKLNKRIQDRLKEIEEQEKNIKVNRNPEDNKLDLPPIKNEEENIPLVKRSKLPDVLPTDRKELEDVIKYAVNNNAEDEFLSKLPTNVDQDKAKDFLLSLKPNERKTKGGIYYSNGSQTFGGGAVGGLESESSQRDYNNDGIHDYKDNLYGALVGAMGINAAKKIMPNAFKDNNLDNDSIGVLINKNIKKEKRGIYNVTFNGKNSSQVKKYDLESLDDFIKYEKGNNNRGAVHIEKHLEDGSMGEVTKDELLDIGNVIRNGNLHLEDGKNIYTLFKDDGTRLRAVTGNRGKEKVITFYSDRNIGRGGIDNSTLLQPTKTNESITKATQQSQDIKLNASPTLSGAAVGTTVGATNDLDQDGKITYKDLLYGTVAGAAGTKLAVKASDNIHGSKSISKLKKIADTDFIDAFTGHKIYQKKDYMNLREKMISSKNAQMEDFVQLHEQLKLLSDDARTELHKYISGDNNVKLSESLKKFGDDYINQIEKQGKELVDLGILDSAQYEKFRGKYLHRVYEKDLTKNISQSFSKGKTIPGVYSRGKEWTGTKAEYEKLLEDGKIGDFFQGKIEARKLNNGQYKFNQDWTTEQRKNWGEIQDIAYTLPETLMRMSEMAEHGKMLSKLSKQNKYLSDEPVDGFVQLNGNRYGALKGKYVPRDIADDISEFNRKLFGEEDGSIFSKEVKEAYSALSTFWKKSHTVYNPTAHVNNLMSNITMQFMEGINPHNAIINAKKGALAHRKLGEFRKLTAKTLIGLSKEENEQLKKLTLDDDLQLYIKAEKSGLFGRSKLNDILGQYINPTADKNFLGKWTIPKSLKKIDEVSSKWYQGEDDIMRFSMLKSLVDDGKSFDTALKEVNNTIPDYTKPMSFAARMGRKSMLTPFISWTYYSTPIILRQFKERPERALAILGAMYGINKAFGIDPYEEKDIPQQNFSMKRIPIYKDGKEVTTLKVDRWMPHNEILSPVDFVRNLYNGGAWKGGYEVLNNQNLYYGGKISYNTGTRKAYDIGKYAAQQITPDAVDKIWNMTESAILSKDKRKKHPVIQPRSSTQEILNFLGLNTLTYDKSQQRKKTIEERLK